jgi:hypothetical protein
LRKIKQCPKCGSTIIIGPTTIGYFGEIDTIKLPLKGTFFTKSAKLDAYFCMDCGYVEQFIPQHELERIHRLIKERGLKES